MRDSSRLLRGTSLMLATLLVPAACGGPPDAEATTGQSQLSLRAADESGTELVAELSGDVVCHRDSSGSVALTGTVTTTGPGDSMRVTASVDGREEQGVTALAPQDFGGEERVRTASFTATLPLQAGPHSLVLCLAWRAADVGEVKRLCTEPASLTVRCRSDAGATPTSDAGRTRDAGTYDGGVRTRDGGSSDAGTWTRDAGSSDAGTWTRDAGSSDAGTRTRDAGF